LESGLYGDSKHAREQGFLESREFQIMKKTSYIPAIAIGLAFALPPTLVMAKSSAGKSAKSCGNVKPEANQPTEIRESPFACDRLALDPEARKRHFEELGPALRVLKKSVRELSDGYEFQFPSDPKTIAMVAEWAAGERLCCPFFDIQLRLEREAGPFWITLTGRKGTKEFIKADAAAWIKQ
jgi:hypothetical protein